MISLRNTRSRLAERLAQRRADERGAYAILVGMTLVLVIALAAIAVDIASQVDSKQRLKDTMDAAAHEAVFALGSGNPADIATAANRAAARNGHDGELGLKYWCVVSSNGATPPNVNGAQIPATCNPGTRRPVTIANYPGTVCDDSHCFIPCDPFRGHACNTVEVEGEREVDYDFAPAIGYDKGSTGTVVSIACKGTCGGETFKSMNVVIMADRTVSMSEGDVGEMVTGIRSSLEIMNPALQYVALGTIHKSEARQMTRSGEVCETAPAGVKQGRYRNNGSNSGSTRKTHGTSNVNYGQTVYVPRSGSQATHYFANSTNDDLWNGNTPRLVKQDGAATQGKWVGVDFSHQYVTDLGSGSPVANASDPLIKGLNCLVRAEGQSNNGTHLAAAMKGAARYLLNPSENNLSRLPRRDVEDVQDVIIFETDGEPSEAALDPEHRLSTTYRNLNSASDFGASGTQGGCDNLLSIANEAKQKGILIITIAYGNANSSECSRNKPVRETLAAASGTSDSGAASASDCSTNAGRIEENSDGDYFFCAAGGDELKETFRTALSSLSNSVRLMKRPRA